MAKLKVYKFVNPGSVASADPAVAAARTQTLSLNRIGGTVSSLGAIVDDLEKVAIAQIKDDEARIKAERRRERRQKDSAAEDSAELRRAAGDQNSPLAKGIKKNKKKNLGLNFGWLENFLGPIASFFLKIGAIALTTELMKYLADPKNREEVVLFLDKAKFVFTKLKEFGEALFGAIGTGLDFIFGKESTFQERIEGFGKIALAIAGIGAIVKAADFVEDVLTVTDTVDDVVDVVDTVEDLTPDKKPRKPPARPGSDAYYDDAVQASKDAAKRNKKGILSRTFGFFQDLGDKSLRQAGRLQNFATEQGKRLVSSLSNLPGWATEQYGRLSRAAKAGWENTVKASTAIAEKGKRWAGAAGQAIKGGFDNLSNGAKNFFLEKILTPIKGIVDPIGKKAAGIGQALFDRLKGLPGMEKAGEILKKKGIGGFGDIAGAGSKLGKRAAAILPVIGGIVNLAFAYDRAANGDSIGALIEGTSGILDIAGLATAGAGNVASMLLDGYMFVRDFIPQLQQGEEAVVDAVGARGLKNSIDNVLSKLPNIGEIINMITGKQSDNTPAPDGEGQTLSDGGSVVEPKPYFLGGIVKGISKAVSGIGRGISKVVSGVGNAIGGVINSPIGRIVTTAAGALIPGAAPIIAGVQGAVSMMQGDPLGAVMTGLNMIPGVSGFIGGVTDTVNKFMSGPVGQIASSLFSGDIAGAAVTGLGLINPEIGQLAGSILSGGFNPMNMIGNIAEQFNMSGLYKAVTGVMGGNYTDAIAELGGQLGIDPKILGAIDRATTKALSKDGISAEYALQEAMEFVPVPVILEKLLPMPTPVPINTPGQTIVTGVPSRLSERS